MESSYVVENDRARARLQALVAMMNDDDLMRSIGHGWTVSAALAHLAFWDRRNLASLEEWEREGVRVARSDPDPINDAMLPQWLAMPPREAAAEALAAAEAVDGKVAALPTARAEEILARSPRSLVRAMHRREHLDEIERVLTR